MGERTRMFQQCIYQSLAKQAGENKEIWPAQMMDVEKFQYEKKNLMKNSNVSKISIEKHKHPWASQDSTLPKRWDETKGKKIHNAKIAINYSGKKMES